ncbi:MAG: endonuclease domain-containing protein, partial [Armatimonadota bacterium]
RYIVDFCCEEARLITEVDGDSHAEREVYDKRRTARLAELGYAAVRVANQDVSHNLDGVLEMILGVCEKRRS